MSRRYGDEVEVRLRDGVPEQFLWRGRLYLVREVLARWCGTGPWWRGPEVRGLVLGLTSRESASRVGQVAQVAGPRYQSTRQSPQQSTAPASVPTGQADPVLIGIDLQERTFWRLSAAAGRSAEVGVYDLCFEESRGLWTLARTHD